MKPFDIFSKTAQFRRMKLILGLCMMLLATTLYIVMVGLPSLASPVLSYVLLPVWAVLSAFLCLKLYHAVGWRIEAGHLAIITGAISEGYIPGDVVSVASDMVSNRFPTRNHYVRARRLTAKAVNELNVVFSRASSLVGEVSGMKMMVEAGRAFLRLHLIYMTRCCLAYTYFRGDEGLYLADAEGCAVYAINWKQLVKKSSDLVALSVVGFLAAITVGFGLLNYFLMGLVHLDAFRYYGVLLAFMLALTLKNAYLDSWYTAFYVHQYMHLAEYSAPSEGFFHRLCKMSPAFLRMWNLANGKLPTPKQTHTFAGAGKKKMASKAAKRAPDTAHPLVCPRCKNANRADAKFCEYCGTRLK